jgi:hypothetical protein
VQCVSTSQSLIMLTNCAPLYTLTSWCLRTDVTDGDVGDGAHKGRRAPASTGIVAGTTQTATDRPGGGTAQQAASSPLSDGKPGLFSRRRSSDRKGADAAAVAAAATATVASEDPSLVSVKLNGVGGTVAGIKWAYKQKQPGLMSLEDSGTLVSASTLHVSACMQQPLVFVMLTTLSQYIWATTCAPGSHASWHPVNLYASKRSKARKNLLCARRVQNTYCRFVARKDYALILTDCAPLDTCIRSQNGRRRSSLAWTCTWTSIQSPP